MSQQVAQYVIQKAAMSGLFNEIPQQIQLFSIMPMVPLAAIAYDPMILFLFAFYRFQGPICITIRSTFAAASRAQPEVRGRSRR